MPLCAGLEHPCVRHRLVESTDDGRSNLNNANPQRQIAEFRGSRQFKKVNSTVNSSSRALDSAMCRERQSRLAPDVDTVHYTFAPGCEQWCGWAGAAGWTSLPIKLGPHTCVPKVFGRPSGAVVQYGGQRIMTHSPHPAYVEPEVIALLHSWQGS